MSRFVHLHAHSHYSLLGALPKLPELVAAAKAQGCEALALTDLGNMYGAIEFIKECKDAGIKPIVGVDLALATGGRLVLLAENNEGYKNLLALVTDSYFTENASTVAVTHDMLRARSAGVIAIATSGQSDPALREIFGDKNLYTDVALREIFYVRPDDRRAWETLRKIAHSDGGAENAYLEEGDFHFPTVAEMEEEFTAEQLARTVEIAERCNVELKLGSWVFPDFPIPAGATYDSELRRLMEEGLVRRGLHESAEVRERIEYEYKIICTKGYSPYFLVVADLLNFARTNGILTTIRGSVAGSMVTFALGITNVNPLEYKLPFERFLNPERPSAPDIDMDYADNRRDEVIEYARRKYGETHVAQIGTFGTMLARGVVRDVARALGYPYGLGDRISKEIPFGSQGFPMTLERALAENPELAKIYKEDEDAKEIIDLGKKLEGSARHISVHAAGVVISPQPLVEYSPLQKDPKGGKIITQYDMHSVEDAGLLKFDFLGIRNLAILAHAVKLVEKITGTKIDIENIPIDDKKTFDMLARGETEGTFQLNGTGMTRYLKELKPSTIHDINAMVALFRPGPMETIPQYIERKHNRHLVHYLDPRMKEYLEFSNGLLVYQDDVLMTAIKLGGYSWLQADVLRKAMGKKIPEVMKAEKEKLIKGFVEFGKLTPGLAEKLWLLIEPFAAYGFGKAHAASYGKVAYQTAYMKANFPALYMAAVLTAESGDLDTISVMVAECKRMGVAVLPPDINESFGDFTAILNEGNGDAIRFGLYSIKNFGAGVADAILAERKENGPFTSLSTFLTRVGKTSLNKRGLESLIECGALDSLGERGQMLASLELLLQYHRDAGAEQSQDSLFADAGASSEIKLPDAPVATAETRLAWEKELLGLYISGHPLDKYREKLSKRPMTIGQMKQRIMPGMTAVAAGMIEDVRMILTRGGDQMAFIKLADFDGSIEAVVFPKDYATHKDMLKPETCVAMKGRVSNRNGELSMVAEAMKAL
ncbi:MAG: DNA polymerase III subunit alpha [Candidatus Adlerbacteria bacterium]|nr:DNA polymerase III subunit alpha [Candidatus Adlerbacteria bacterium]